MPVYELQCKACGKVKEVICIWKEAKKGLDCDRCEGKMELIMSVPYIVTDETRARRILSKGRAAGSGRRSGRA